MKRATCLVCLAALGAAFAHAAATPPAAGVWNIATTGRAASSGDLEFRITSTDGSDPVEITVPVIAGASQDSMARSIRRALSAQLPGDRFDVQLGESNNVLVSDARGQPNFSLELIDSNIDDVRVAVQSVTPAAPPTVPPQSVPAVPPPASQPGNTAPGNATQPPNSSTPIPPPSGVPSPDTPVFPPADGAPPAAPAPSPNAPTPNPDVPPPGSSPQAPAQPSPPAPDPGAPAPGAPGGAGAGASAPPPN